MHTSQLPGNIKAAVGQSLSGPCFAVVLVTRKSEPPVRFLSQRLYNWKPFSFTNVLGVSIGRDLGAFVLLYSAMCIRSSGRVSYDAPKQLAKRYFFLSVRLTAARA